MKVRTFFSLLFNVLSLTASIVGFVVISKVLTAVDFMKYFTIVTNCMIIISSLVSIGYSIDKIIKKDKETVVPSGVFVLKLITAVGSLITLFTVVFYLQYTVYKNIGPKDPLFWNNIFHHYAATGLFTLGFVLFDLDKKYPFKLTFLGILALFIYSCYAIPLSNIEACKSWFGEPPYVFLSFATVKWWALVLIPGFFIGGYVISFLLWLLNRIVYLIFIGQEVMEDEIYEEEETVDEKKIIVSDEDRQEVNEVIKSGYSGPRIYHVSKRREDKKWQVKFANGQRAIKLFDTQAEAIVFAKKLAKSQEGSIRVHSLKGKIRKAH